MLSNLAMAIPGKVATDNLRVIYLGIMLNFESLRNRWMKEDAEEEKEQMQDMADSEDREDVMISTDVEGKGEGEADSEKEGEESESMVEGEDAEEREKSIDVEDRGGLSVGEDGGETGDVKMMDVDQDVAVGGKSGEEHADGTSNVEDAALKRKRAASVGSLVRS